MALLTQAPVPRLRGRGGGAGPQAGRTQEGALRLHGKRSMSPQRFRGTPVCLMHPSFFFQGKYKAVEVGRGERGEGP